MLERKDIKTSTLDSEHAMRPSIRDCQTSLETQAQNGDKASAEGLGS